MQKQASTDNPARRKITPVQYSRFLQRLNLTNIVLQDVKCTVKTRELTGKNTFMFDEKTVLRAHDENGALVEVEYIVKAKSGRKIVVDIRAKYLVGFTTTARLSEDFFSRYNEINLPLHTFPYFRELVHSLFYRTGLPPLVLPLRKFLLKDSK